MIYSLQLIVGTDRDYCTTRHTPVEIITLESDKSKVTDEEVYMVTTAFQAQIRDLILIMTKGKGNVTKVGNP
jgi:hypothetical protein